MAKWQPLTPRSCRALLKMMMSPALSFETALIRAEGSLDVYDMQRILEETYGCTVSDRSDLIYKVAGSGVYYDKHLDRLYESENRYWRDVDETEAQL